MHHDYYHAMYIGHFILDINTYTFYIDLCLFWTLVKLCLLKDYDHKI